jgi:BirA family biotin operon repressor/biotin-[acetyl-CoA-carboxylase] ligase
MRRARAGACRPTLLVAEAQTAGRGRLGRAWVSGPIAGGPCAGLAGADLLAGPVPGAADWSGLSLAVGVSVARALHPALQLKWPNDLWLDGRKLAGILIETAQLAGQRCAVIGVASTCGPPTPPACRCRLPACRNCCPTVTRPPRWPAHRAGTAGGAAQFEAQGPGPFQAEFHARDLLRGRTVVLSDGSSGTARASTPAAACWCILRRA